MYLFSGFLSFLMVVFSLVISQLTWDLRFRFWSVTAFLLYPFVVRNRYLPTGLTAVVYFTLDY